MKKTFIILIVGVFVGLILAYISAGIIDSTSKPEFCASCHTMKPMADSFKISVHGANNKHGFSAEHCTDCHLPQKSLSGYLIAKGLSGTKDTLSEIGIGGRVDFVKNYWKMEDYVYDSGCLKCHQSVKSYDTAYGMNESSRIAHKQYWGDKNKGLKVSCVSCHNDYVQPGFAHPELLEKLESAK